MVSPARSPVARSRVIARRVLWLAPGPRRITVSIEAPEPDPASPHGDWRCVFRVTGNGRRLRRHAHGIDAFQALQLAMEGIRIALAPERDQLTWPGGTLASAFPAVVPAAWGEDVARQLEASMAQAVDALHRKSRPDR